MRLPRAHLWLRLLASLALLGALSLWLDTSAIVAEIQGLSPYWVLLALILTLPQVAISAWRWRLTARLLNIRLPWRVALGDYYLATFLNQVLPGGVMGDATRAWRHAQASGQRAAALRAVIIERTSGQLVLAAMACATLFSPIWHQPLARFSHSLLNNAASHSLSASVWLGGLFLLLMLGLLFKRIIRRPPRLFKTRYSALLTGLFKGLGGDLHRTLLSHRAWPRQLLGSALVVCSYVAVFVCAARAIGSDLPLTTLLTLIPLVLLAMAIPLSVAGWGLREGAAALVWAGAGLAPAQGVAISVAYGLLVLISSLPGALFLIRRRSRRLVGGEHQIEQGVLTAGKGPGPGSQRLIESRDGCQIEPRASRADQKRCDQHMQAVQYAGFEKARDGHPAAFDQYPFEPAPAQCIEHTARIEPLGPQGQHDALHVTAKDSRHRGALADNMQGRGLTGVKDIPSAIESSARVEHHPHRRAPRDVAHVELGVVRLDGTGTDQDRIHQGPQPMQMNAAFKPVDVVGRAGHGGDSTIQALTELSDRQGFGSRHQWQQIIKQTPHLVSNPCLTSPGAAFDDVKPRSMRHIRDISNERSGR